jgi:hypothetical protein
VDAYPSEPDAAPLTLAVVYEKTADGYRCPRHGVAFGRAESCGGCVADPGVPLEDAVEPEAKPPAGCMSTIDIERSLSETADQIQAIIRKLILKTSGSTGSAKIKKRLSADDLAVMDTHLANTYAKLVDVYLKTRNRQYECAKYREEESLLMRLAREKRDLERGAAH